MIFKFDFKLNKKISGEAAVGRILIENGAEVNTKDDESETPLHYAAGEGAYSSNFCIPFSHLSS